jgi:hypothetical protein
MGGRAQEPAVTSNAFAEDIPPIAMPAPDAHRKGNGVVLRGG